MGIKSLAFVLLFNDNVQKQLVRFFVYQKYKETITVLTTGLASRLYIFTTVLIMKSKNYHSEEIPYLKALLF